MREKVSEDLQIQTVCVCVCVCERERERERESGKEILNSQSLMSISSDTPGRVFIDVTSTEKVYVCPLVRPEISVVVRPLSTSILPSPPPPARP